MLRHGAGREQWQEVLRLLQSFIIPLEQWLESACRPGPGIAFLNGEAAYACQPATVNKRRSFLRQAYGTIGGCASGAGRQFAWLDLSAIPGFTGQERVFDWKDRGMVGPEIVC